MKQNGTDNGSLIEVSAITTGETVKVARIKPHIVIACIAAVMQELELKVKWEQETEEYRTLVAQTIANNTISLLIGKGYIRIDDDQFERGKQAVVSNLETTGDLKEVLIKRVLDDPILMLRNIIMNQFFPHGLLDKLTLFSEILKHSGLVTMVGGDVDPILKALELAYGK